MWDGNISSNNPGSSRWNLLQIHIAVLLFGFAGLFGDARFLPLTSIVLVFGRVVFASLALLLVGLVRRDIFRPLSARSVFAFAVLGVLLAGHWTMFFQSVQMGGVALALITYSTFPIFVAFLEPLFFREKYQAIDFILAAVALAGVAILTPRFELRDRTTQGVLWGIASGLTFALLSLLNRRFVRHHASMTIALYQDLFAVAALSPVRCRGLAGLDSPRRTVARCPRRPVYGRGAFAVHRRHAGHLRADGEHDRLSGAVVWNAFSHPLNPRNADSTHGSWRYLDPGRRLSRHAERMRADG